MDTVKYYGVKYLNKEILMNSQSGGAFYAISKYFIDTYNAVIYGCGMSINNEAIYLRITELDKLSELQGSKYVQARVYYVYEQIKNDLDLGMYVLFSGTPCYVSGVKHFFESNPHKDHLYTIDLICHGVPSPLVFQEYKKHYEQKYNKKIKKFIFRDKKEGGWHRAVEKIIFSDDEYVLSEEFNQLFYTNLPIRRSCGNCVFSSMDRKGDFTIGDFWGIQKSYPDFDDEKGVSLIFCNNTKSIKLFDEIKKDFDLIEVTKDQVCQQPNLQHSTYIPKCQNEFWRDFYNRGIEYCIKHWSPYKSNIFRIKRKIMKILNIW